MYRRWRYVTVRDELCIGDVRYVPVLYSGCVTRVEQYIETERHVPVCVTIRAVYRSYEICTRNGPL